MAPINRISMASQSITTNTDTVIEMVYSEPASEDELNPPQPPGKIVGYYNGMTNEVNLYVVSANGLKLLRVV